MGKAMDILRLFVQRSAGKLPQSQTIQSCEKVVEGQCWRSVLPTLCRQIQNIQSSILRQGLQEGRQILHTMLGAQIPVW